MDVRYVLGAVLLSIATITDIRTREVPDWLSYGFILIGLVINTVFSLVFTDVSFILFSVTMSCFSFITMYILWRFGIFGGGDVKLLTALSSVIPFLGGIPSFLFVLFTGVLASAPYFFVYLILKTDKKFWKDFVTRNRSRILSSMSFFLLVYLGFTINGLLGILLFVFGLIFSRVLTYLLPVLLVLCTVFQQWYAFLYSGGVILFVLFFELVKCSGRLLSRRKRVSKKLVGEILAYDVVEINGEIITVSKLQHMLLRVKGTNPKPIVLSRAAGLTEDEISTLKRLGFRYIDIKESVPMVPVLLLGYLLAPFVPSIIR